MSEQVEALEIANKVDTKIVSYPPRYVYCDAAAAELRRQYQEITELKKAKEELLEVLDQVVCFGGLSLDLWRAATAVLNSHKD